MADFTLRVNGSEKKVSVSPETPLLWVLRDTLELTGTKFGCGAGFCGACTVHVEGEAIRSCSTPVSQAGSEPGRRGRSEGRILEARGTYPYHEVPVASRPQPVLQIWRPGANLGGSHRGPC